MYFCLSNDPNNNFKGGLTFISWKEGGAFYLGQLKSIASIAVFNEWVQYQHYDFRITPLEKKKKLIT